ncbi:hypothetical protein [Arthrobacter sp. B2a2-09]|uniref:hypothetical protein n=1 Tax=Arthrobacter sp. B2a2-09 TaxID=2952822 RepID=UPI0022CD8487|nr:hypothetical protein [Arthrobacter sp. B2a2-09]
MKTLCRVGVPQWTLHAAAEQEYQGPGAQWVPQFRAGRRKPPSSRTDAVRPWLSHLKEPESDAGDTHLSWTPRSITALTEALAE